MINRQAVRAAGLASLLSLAACGSGEQQQPPEMPPPLVTAITVRTQSVPNIIELPGRIEAVRSAEVRARTDGIIERRLYEEGTDVGAGQALFRIDQRDYRAQVAQAQAVLQRAQAARTNAAAIVNRYRPLVRERAVSAQEYDTALADMRTADANIADARAALSRAQLQLSYTIVRAPIAGRIGRAEVTEGALVSAASATLLTRVDQMTPVYAVFAQPNAETLNLVRQQHQGTVKLPALNNVVVKLTLENGVEYGPAGRLDFAGQTVEPTTGSQTVRAVFPNPERLLLPGQFVRGHIELGQTADGIAIPQRAVQLAGDRASVSVVARDGTVSARPIELGAQVGGQWIVRSGLRAGEQIIIEGWQKAQPGQKVKVQPPGQPKPQQQQQGAAPKAG